MGIYDRDYYRKEGPSFLGSIATRAPVCKWLILINAVVFLIQLATIQRLPFRSPIEGSFTEGLWLDPARVMQGEVWRLLTATFLHSTTTPWHILMNMFVLWWAGSDVEEIRGSKEFLGFYLVSGAISSIIYTATMLPFPVPPPAVGASGAVTAVLVLFACHYPHRTLLLMFVIPVPAWLLVVLFVGHDLIVWVGQTETHIAVTAHLGGALFGWLYHQGQWRVTGILSWFEGWRRTRTRPPLKIYREEEPATVPARAPAEHEIDEHFEAKLDAVLEKMSLVGKDNLTDGEKDILLKASEIYRRRRN
jgi:membrane associated rhomboid family serine protease